MKKLLTSMLILVVTVGTAAAIEIKPADIRRAAQLKLSQVNPGTYLKNLERMMGLSLKSAAPKQKFSPEVIAAQVKNVNLNFSLRRTWLEENAERIEKLMNSAYGSHLAATHSNVLTQEQFFDLAILDTYGPNPSNKYFTPIVYSGLEFVEYPFTTTKENFWVMAHQFGEDVPVFIPAGSKIQVGGNLVERNMHDVEGPWIEHVAHVLRVNNEELYEVADRSHVAKNFDFTGKDFRDIFFSEQADQIFSPIFLGRNGTPTAFTRVPLRVNNSDFPAGSMVALYHEDKVGYYPIEQWSTHIYSPDTLHLDMLGINFNSVDELPMEELFTHRTDNRGAEIYSPKVLMFYYDDLHGPCIIGPEDVLTVVMEKGKEKLSLPVDAQPMSVDAFKLAVEIPLPAEEEILANLPEEDPFQTFDPKKVELRDSMLVLEDPFTGKKKVANYLGGDERDVRVVFGDDSPLVAKVQNGWKLTVEDLETENARLQAKRQGLEGPVVPPFGKTGNAKVDAWIAEGKVSCVAEKYSSSGRKINVHILFRVLEPLKWESGQVMAEPGDYLEVKGGGFERHLQEYVDRVWRRCEE